MAATVAQVIQPDYLVLGEEPDSESFQAAQPNINIPGDAAAMIGGEIAAVQALNLSNPPQMGAGFGSWVANLNQYISDYVALPLDYIDFHILDSDKKLLRKEASRGSWGAMEWRLDFARAEVPEELDGLKAATARLCDNMVQEIEGFSFKLHRDLKQAIVDAQSGDKVVLQITLTLTSPGTDEIANETQRLKDLIISGGLA